MPGLNRLLPLPAVPSSQDGLLQYSGNLGISLGDTYATLADTFNSHDHSDGGGAPVPLTSAVSGILPVVNGGTGNDTLAADRLLVGNGTGPIVAVSELFWDSVNKSLGINNAAPSAQLQVQRISAGTCAINIVPAAGNHAAIDFFDGPSTWSGRFLCATGNVAGSRYFGLYARTDKDSTPLPIRLITMDASLTLRDTLWVGAGSAQGRVGVGVTASPSYPLHVKGTIYSEGGNVLLDNNKYVQALKAGGGTESLLWLNTSNWANVCGTNGILLMVGGTEIARVTTGGRGRLGVGLRSTPLGVIHGANESTSAICYLETASSSYTWDRPIFYALRSRGTLASREAVQANDYILTIAGAGMGTGLSWGYVSAEIHIVAADAPGTNYVAGHILLSTNPGASASPVERMRITKDGYVGIGTTSPSTRLHVSGDLYVQGGTISLDNSKALTGKTSGGSQQNIVIIDSSNITRLGGSAGVAIDIGGAEKVRVSSSGYLGVGVTSPGSMLHVKSGNSGAATASTDVARFESASTISVSILSGGDSGLYFSTPSSYYDGALYYDNANKTLKVYAGATFVAAFVKGAYATYLGIGTSSPSSTLDVVGNVEIGSSNAMYFGDPSTDGSWRLTRSGDNFVVQRRESGSWITKTTIYA